MAKKQTKKVSKKVKKEVKKSTMVNTGKIKMPKGLESIINGIVGSLREKGVDINSIVEDCGNPDCPVHGKSSFLKNKGITHKFVPETKENRDKIVQTAHEVLVEGRDGLVFVAKLVDDKGGPFGSIGALQGSLKINNVALQHVLLSFISQMGMTKEEAIQMITDPRFSIQNGPSRGL